MAAAASIIFKRVTRGGAVVLTKKFFSTKLAPSISICSSRAFNTWGHIGSLHSFLAKSEGLSKQLGAVTNDMAELWAIKEGLQTLRCLEVLPMSVAAAGRLVHLLYEINNTFVQKKTTTTLVQLTSPFKHLVENDIMFTEEDNNAFYFEFVMPGLGKEDVEVNIEENNMLSVKGKYSSGITCGRSILLGTNKRIMRDEITAEMKNGVLKVKVPKMKDEEKKNVIKVNVV